MVFVPTTRLPTDAHPTSKFVVAVSAALMETFRGLSTAVTPFTVAVTKQFAATMMSETLWSPCESPLK
ncbi:MAG: hypothetical protein DMD25_13985 [Gemmatimonadetes bacterium]|nr:MAG: hypothetical protein DMD25_13985 [Gemmatimonadota bacterium]